MYYMSATHCQDHVQKDLVTWFVTSWPTNPAWWSVGPSCWRQSHIQYDISSPFCQSKINRQHWMLWFDSVLLRHGLWIRVKQSLSAQSTKKGSLVVASYRKHPMERDNILLCEITLHAHPHWTLWSIQYCKLLIFLSRTCFCSWHRPVSLTKEPLTQSQLICEDLFPCASCLSPPYSAYRYQLHNLH